MKNAYWSHYRGMSADTYVERFVDASEVDRQRMKETVAALPADVTKLLDVGCGFGHFLSLVRELRGIIGSGVEITEEKVEYARRAMGVDARVASVEALPFADRTFDAVCALEVIEHLPLIQFDRGRAELSRVANRWILISVPWRERRLNVECPVCGCAFNHNYHLRSFCDADFAMLFPGFTLRSLVGMGDRREAAAWVHALSAWRRRKLPPFAVCPACGYHSESPVNESMSPYKESFGLRRFLVRSRSVARYLVSRTVPCWYLALFERTEDPRHLRR